MKSPFLVFTALAAATALTLAGCEGRSSSSITPASPQANVGGAAGGSTITIQGNLVGDASQPLIVESSLGGENGAGLEMVPLTGPTAVVAVDEIGKVAASQVVTPSDGRFRLDLPSERSFMILFRKGSPAGVTLSHLIVDRATGRIAFTLPKDSPNLNLGNVTIDSHLGKASAGIDPDLAVSAAVFPLDTIEWRGTSDVPTGGKPSPLFGAEPFTQQMLRFEEFGTEPFPAQASSKWMPLPQPMNAQSGPPPMAFEAFLAQTGVAPLPTRRSNVNVENPWKGAIEAFLGRKLALPDDGSIPGVAGPAEGRAPGEGWAHQFWDTLFPQQFFKTGVTGARRNGGLRDMRQRHGYKLGEFGPGGLYHNVAGVPATEGTAAGVDVRFHPKMPLQNPNSIWTFDGTLPPKLFVVRHGIPVLMRNYNALPIDVTANNGFGRHTISTHEHNGHQPGESDGFFGAFFFPGQFYDYRWPLQLAAFSNLNNAAGAANFDASDPRAALPCDDWETITVLVNGIPTDRTCRDGRIMIPGDWRETMSSHWFHDHMKDHTAENVYKGNASKMNYYSALDRGNEAYDDGVNLRFPSGASLSWGNRDYDVNILLADKAWTADGQLWFNTRDTENGFIGDRVLTNWLFKPWFDVRARKYRFRFLNGATSRVFGVALVHRVAGDAGELPGPPGSNVSYNRVPFHMIANDGNILEHAVPFDGVADLMHDGNPDPWKGQLPSLAIAERYDIVVDFGKYGIRPGDKLYFVNVMEHQNGKGTRGRVPLAEILSGEYNPTVLNGRWVNGDPGVGLFLELRVHAYEGTDVSMNPADFEPGKRKMIPLPLDREKMTVNGVSLLAARHHTFEFVHSGGVEEETDLHGPWFIKVDGGPINAAIVERISALQHGAVEVWEIAGGRGWTHPVHIHFEEGFILTRNGRMPPEWEMWARKDMYRIGPEPESGVIQAAIRARDFFGRFMQHCHNTMHEDHAMLMRWDSAKAGAVLMDAPLPTFDGVFLEPSFALETAETGDGIGLK
ncbi:MAG: multicopper oxidase domain-containing protein [Thermodesulfobacteriota bacterium]